MTLAVTAKHADLIDFQQLKDLLRVQAEPKVSITIPTHLKGPETQQDRIRLKNRLREAEELLIGEGLRPEDAKSLLEEAHDLERDNDFWNYQREALALFIAADVFAYYRLPLRIEGRVIVDRMFHILPMIPVLMPDTRFHVLALNQNHIRLFEGTRYTIDEIDLEDVPTSLKEFLADTQTIRSFQFHTGTGARADAGRRGAVFHGQGVQDDKNEKKMVLNYFHRLDHAVRDFLTKKSGPLVLAGQPHIQALYREASHGNGILEKGIPRNPDDLSDHQIQHEAWEIVSAEMEETREKDEQRFLQIKGNGHSEKAATSLEETAPAAFNKRLDTLFVPKDGIKWGAFDPAASEIQIHQTRHTSDLELFNFASAHTLQNGGKVYAVERDRIPSGSEVAAILR
ncbi:MAG: hypothetical protein KC940_15150 [Candidatus Omnitrophica bacterium]|nr:hypothetical protein [Candidatus Omnitrophota bacterium]